jgi:ribose/xylose/arabinose/galactoside ABC-type transport system permease subunit
MTNSVRTNRKSVNKVPWPLASLVALGTGVLLGLFNGAVIHYLRIPPFIVTFSTYGVATSVPMIIAEVAKHHCGG